MEHDRRHPDVFSAAEALAYLHRDPVADANLIETLRDKGVLIGTKIGRELMFHREELDAAVMLLFSDVLKPIRDVNAERRTAQPDTGPRIRMTGSR